jgi:hypothetical protein
MKDRIKNSNELWIKGYEQVPIYLHHIPQLTEVYKDGLRRSNPGDVHNRQLNRGGEAAYASAIHWIITENLAHIEKAVEILKAWAYTTKEIDDNGDGSLSTSYNYYIGTRPQRPKSIANPSQVRSAVITTVPSRDIYNDL